MVALLEPGDFKPHVGKVFRFKGTPFTFPLKEIIVSPRQQPEGLRRQAFTLIFRATKEREYLSEGSYESEVENGPVFTLYVIPIHTPEPAFQDYQVVFN